MTKKLWKFNFQTLTNNNVKSEGKFEGYRIRAVHCLRNGSVLAADTHNRCLQQLDFR